MYELCSAALGQELKEGVNFGLAGAPRAGCAPRVALGQGGSGQEQLGAVLAAAVSQEQPRIPEQSWQAGEDELWVCFLTGAGRSSSSSVRGAAQGAGSCHCFSPAAVYLKIKAG